MNTRKLGLVISILLFGIIIVGLYSLPAHAETIASQSTSFNLIGSNDRVEIEAIDDPKVSGVACHLSRAVKGGLKADVGLASDTSDSSIACRQIGPISFNGPLKDGEEVFNVKQSLFFKTMHVTRYFDKQRNVLIYLVFSDKLINGSRKNSISTVPIQKW